MAGVSIFHIPGGGLLRISDGESGMSAELDTAELTNLRDRISEVLRPKGLCTTLAELAARV